MAWAQFIPMAIQMVEGAFQGESDKVDAMQAKRTGLATANANEERIRRNSAQELGVQRAAMAESGFAPNTGAALALQKMSAGNAELDALTERYKGQFAAWQSDEKIQRQRDKDAFMLDPIFSGRKSAGSLLLGAGISYFAGSKVANRKKG